MIIIIIIIIITTTIIIIIIMILCSELSKFFSLLYTVQPFKPRIKSHLLFAGIIRSSPFSPR